MTTATFTARVEQAYMGTCEVFRVTEAQPPATIRRLRRALEATGAWTRTISEPYGLETPATAEAQRIILDHTFEGGFAAWYMPPED